MTPTSYPLRRFAIAKTRNEYVVFGFDNSTGVRYHSRLPDSNMFYSARNALRWLQAEVEAGRLTPSTMIPNGHHAGAVSCVSGHCDERFCRNEAGETTFELSRNPWDVAEFALPWDRFTLQDPVPVEHALEQEFEDVAVPEGFLLNAPPTGIRPADGIKSFGVELECLVPVSREDRVAALLEQCSRMTRHHDGSVRNRLGGGFNDAEFTFWSTSMDEMKVWLRKMYTEIGVRTNNSCGFHVHVKPYLRRRWAFTTKHYWTGFGNAYRAFAAERAAKFAARIGRRWCVLHPWDAYRVRTAIDGERGRGDRYTAINLCSLTRHSFGTIEHRILPAQSNAREAISSIEWLMTTVSALVMEQTQPDEETAEVIRASSHPSMFPLPRTPMTATTPMMEA